MSAEQRQHLEDHLVDRITFNIPEGELDLSSREAEAVAAELERAAACLFLAGTAGEAGLDEMPASLKSRISLEGKGLVRARAGVEAPVAEAPPVSAPRPAAAPAQAPAAAAPPQAEGGSPILAWSGWLAAAAAVLFLVLSQGGGDTAAATPAESRAELLATAGDVVELEWAATGDAYSPEIAGDVVWSHDRQEGYMRFRGLTVNDPTDKQYQLWIIDADRAEPQPIDGGVFDAEADGEIVVPIEAKLPVGQAGTFLVTLEEPGGVVVSAAEHVLVTAAAG